MPLAESFARLNEYPEGTYRELRDAAASYAGLQPEQVVVGAGADDLIALVARTFLAPGRKAYVREPTYGLYAIASAIDDGITYYNKSRPVDEPMIATVSSDREWVVASVSKTTGNVWSNPELTCQHVDPERPLPARAKVEWDVKILIFQGSLDQVLKKVESQRPLLK